MKLPPIKIRQYIYKFCKIAIPAVGVLYAMGFIQISVAGTLVTLLGTVSNVLADKGAHQLQEDGTTLLTGSVPEQVNKGMEILINEAIKTIDTLDVVGKNAVKVREVQNQISNSVLETPVLGDLARQAIKLA